jgi:tetratricopeptide (TPR) repeat protein
VDPIAEQLIARLQGDPHDSAAYEALKAHYRHSGDMASLGNLLEGWAAAHSQDASAASEAYAEAADAVLQSTADLARAKRLYRHAVQLDVRHTEAATRLQALLEDAAEYQELAEFLDAYVRALEAAGGAEAQLPALYQRLAQIWEQEFERSDVAAAYYERAAELSGAPAAGGSAPALHGGAALASAQAHADPHAFAAECEREAEAELDPERKSALLSRLADVRASLLGDLGGAIQALRQALALTPGDVATMHQLATCLLTRAASAAPEAARTDQRRVAELFYQIAQAVDPQEAIPYLESALAAMPDHDGALAQLERLAPAQGRADLLPQYWVGYVASAGEGPERNLRRLALGQAYLQAEQFEDAIYCLQPAAEYGNDRAHELLQEAYGRQGRAQARSDVPTEIENAEPSLLPTTRPRERRTSDAVVRESAQLSALRKQVHDALAGRRHDEAAEHCKQILELEPSDPEAFTLLESHYRKRRDHASLRDLLLASTRAPGLSVDVRKLRLREVATLSETKLRDGDAAISAWRGVVTFDPSDREASSSLKRLLKKAQQWDELASVLEREAIATNALEEKAALLREIALIHRDKRNDPAETAEAFRQLHALKPDDTAVRDELCELLISLEYWADAVPLIRERIAATSDEIDKLKLSVALAAILHENLNDYDAAFEACEQILKLRPNDRATFDRMEKIDEATQNYERLLKTVGRRAAIAGKAERPALFIRMGDIAEQQLHDLDKAAEYLGDALDLVPDNQEALQRLSQMFESAGRYDQLVELLRERTLLEKEPKNRAPFYRRIAQTLAERVQDDAAAADAYRSLLELTEDEAALRYLRDFAVRNEDNEELSHTLRRLAALVTDNVERRDLLFDQAVLLHERMARSNEAAVALKRIVDEIDPQFEPAIELLATVAEATDDKPALALALERRLSLLGTPEARQPLAKRLAELCEHEIKDSARAITALQQWARDDAQNVEPLRRLRELLQKSERWKELLATLDALAEWEQDFDARDEAAIAAAQLAHAKLGDAEGAFGRLLPLVEQRNEIAERALREIALGSGMQRQLAALYVKLAQETEDPAAQALYWMNAAEIFERELSDSSQALEASLRMLATDLSNRQFLTYVDRLAVATANYKRLGQVYERLLKQAEDDADRVALLKRHADLLEAEQPDEALDRILRACALMPHDEPLLGRAEQLAQRTRRSEELLVVYDRRRAKSDDDAAKLRLLLRAARLCDGALRDRERASKYLKAALALSGESAELGAEVEAVARELDADRPELGADNARRALIASHREIAEHADPAAANRLLLRAAELLSSELDDDRSAFDVLRQALSQLPKSDQVYAALIASAERLKRLDAVDAHVARLIDDAIDSNTAVVLLKRRGELLEGPLNRWQDAAAVYTKLLQLRPDDAEVAERLRASLRKSGRFQDLLLALNKQLQRTREPQKRIKLLKEMAASWEQDLKNRWEAVDAWKAVLREAGDDAEALAALQRLERSRTTPPEQLVDDGPVETDAEAIAAGERAPADAPVVADRSEGEAAEAFVEPGSASASAAAQHSDHDVGTAIAETRAAEVDEAAERDEEAAQAVAPSSVAPVAGAEAGDSVPQTAPPDAEPGATDADGTIESEAAKPPRFLAEVDDGDDGDLAALDARLSATSTPEEVDVLEDLDAEGVNVEFDDKNTIPAPRRASAAPPPLPARGGPTLRPSQPSAGGRTSSVPPPPPRAAPPVPLSASEPGGAQRSSSVPPPLPNRPGAPPPLPSAPSRSNPPPLPSQRKQD